MPETAALQKPMTGFHLKLIALTTMFIDHIGAVFFPQVTQNAFCCGSSGGSPSPSTRS